jgi:hypothetical protein
MMVSMKKRGATIKKTILRGISVCCKCKNKKININRDIKKPLRLLSNIKLNKKKLDKKTEISRGR